MSCSYFLFSSPQYVPFNGIQLKRFTHVWIQFLIDKSPWCGRKHHRIYRIYNWSNSSSIFIDQVTQLNETVKNICFPTPSMLLHSHEELWVWALSIVNIINTIMHHSVLGTVFADFLCQYNQNKTQLPVAIKNLPFTNYLMFVYSILQLCSQDTANIPRQY